MNFQTDYIHCTQMRMFDVIITIRRIYNSININIKGFSKDFAIHGTHSFIFVYELKMKIY